MAISGNKRNRQTFSEINITPLTDVFLVLLVIMFLIAPLLDDQALLKVNPPSAKSAKTTVSQEKAKSILIEIDQDGQIAVNGDVLVKEDDENEQIYDKLYAKVSELAPTTGKTTDTTAKPKIKLKADNKSTHGRVVSVYDVVAKAKSEGRVGQLVLVTVKRQ